MNSKTDDNAQAIKDLNELLKIELSAIETYGQALSKLQDQGPSQILRTCQQSHTKRADKLRPAISDLGGTPPTDIGLGGQFGKLVMNGATALGDKAIILALEADEGEWSAAYEWRLVSMHGGYRPLVKDQLLPEQKQIEEKIRELANKTTEGAYPATPGTKDI